jgi:hypothetical protein
MADKDFRVKNKLHVNGLNNASGVILATNNALDSHTTLPTQYGGTGTTTSPTSGQVLYSSGGTNYAPVTFTTLPGVYARGNTASRPASPAVGDLYYNTELNYFESYTSNGWFPIAAAPLAPTGVTATNQGTGRAYNNGQMSVAFTPNTSGGAPTSFTVTSSPGGYTNTGSSSPIVITGLQSSTQYTYTITATSPYGTSSASSASSGVTATTVPQAPTIGTATSPTATSAEITFTSNATGGSTITSYTATSSPGNITGTGSSSPITVSGLTSGTAYTFTVTATNANGTSSASASSNSVTPVNVIGLLGAWSSSTPTISGQDGAAYYGWTRVGANVRAFHVGVSRGVTLYYNNGRGGTWSTGADRPTGQSLGSSSKTLTNSNRFYTYGGDTGTQTLVYSTQDGSSWRQENSLPYNAGWSGGTYFNNGGNGYLIAAAEYPTGTTAAKATVNSSDGSLSWGSYTGYPVYAAAVNMQALTSKALAFGGFTSTSLSGRRADVYSTTGGGSWTSETSLPFTPGGGYVNSAQVTGGADSRVYVVNGTSVWSRGDSSGTWRSETSLPDSVGSGWGTVDSGGTKYLQFVSTSAPANYYQLIS